MHEHLEPSDAQRQACEARTEPSDGGAPTERKAERYERKPERYGMRSRTPGRPRRIRASLAARRFDRMRGIINR
jgi:hypothetical protein